MGKPFKKELEKLNETIDSCNDLDLGSLERFLSCINSPVYIVGSGGSLSACYFAVDLLQKKGGIAKAITPLELLYSRETLSNSIVLFISASGRNTDIKLGLKKAIEEEPISIGVICMKKKSPLALIGEKHSIVELFEYECLYGKDGFLATNSLVAFFSILYRAVTKRRVTIPKIQDSYLNTISDFLETTKKECTYSVLYGGWSKSIAMDVESKCSEAALSPTLISDFRNFGHGRHQWFDKRENSAIISICGLQDRQLSNKTLDSLPNNIPKLTISSDLNRAEGSIDLLIKSFYLISLLGAKMGIDPGKPGVPEYGRKLYHLSYISLLPSEQEDFLSTRARISIRRKIKGGLISSIPKTELMKWRNSYKKFIQTITNEKYGMILLDYDGTICSHQERYSGPSDEIIQKITEILNKGFLIGVVTGRGKSARKKLQELLPKKHWKKVVIGYYNGSDIGLLEDCSLPNTDKAPHRSLEGIESSIGYLIEEYDLDIQTRPNQITIEITDKRRWTYVRDLIIQEIKTKQLSGIQILESSHSMDIIPDSISKLNVLDFCKEIIEKYKLANGILRIGDKGQWSGNDFALLDSNYGLSVHEVSSKFDTCWNIASLGNRNVSATLEYLNSIDFSSNYMKFKFRK